MCRETCRGRFNLIANYSFSSAKTWGCILGELFDYVNGVCNPLRPFGPGDYGPSGEDVGSRVVVAGIFRAPAGLTLSLLFQAEGAAAPYIDYAGGCEWIGRPGKRSRGD